MIVTTLQDIIERYNEDEQCGFCWSFIHARKDYANLVRPCVDGVCCVNFLLENYTSEERYNGNESTRDHELSYTEYSFDAFAGFQGALDIQYHNETTEGIDESKYITAISPLETCFESFGDEICGTGLHPIRLRIESKVNYKDSNLDGVFIRGTFRKYA